MGRFKRDYSGWRPGTARVLQQRGGELDLEVTVDSHIYTAIVDAPKGGVPAETTLSVRVHPTKQEKVHVEWGPLESGPQAAVQLTSVAGLQQLLGNLAASGSNVQVVDGGSQVIDASNVPGLRDEILGVLEQHGIQIPDGVEAGSSSDPVERLEKLAQLKQAGLLTDEQFEAAKKQLLAQ